MFGNITPRGWTRLFWALLAATFAFRLWYATTLPLTGDEAYHWEWSRHPATGYYDHPGLAAYLVWISTHLFGRSTELTVRLPAMLLLAGTAVVCFLFARRLTRDQNGTELEVARAGFVAGALVLITPIFSFMSMYMSTDPPLIFTWALSLYLAWVALQSGTWLAWIGFGLAMGLAFQSKFLSFFLPPAIGLFVLCSAQDRKRLLRPQPYVAAVIALLVFLPFLLWNASNNWPTFMFNFEYRQKVRGLQLFHIPEYFLSQAFLAVSPGIFLYATGRMFRALRAGFRDRDRPALFVALTSLFTFTYFLYVSFTRQIGLHWPVAAWLGLFAWLGWTWRQPAPTRAGRVSRAVSVAVCLLISVSVHLVLHIPPGWVKAVQWAYSADPARFNTEKNVERFGWPELGAEVERRQQQMVAAQGANPPGVFVICPEYGFASTVAFYTPSQIRTHLWADRRTHGENFRFWDDFRALKGQDAIFVAKNPKAIARAMPLLRKHFVTVEEPQPFGILVDGEQVRTFLIVPLRGFNGITPDFTRLTRR